MPDQFGNPLPGELSIPNVGGFAPDRGQFAQFAAQAPAPPTEQQLMQERAARGEELTPQQVAVLQGTPSAPAAPVAQPVQQAPAAQQAPTQFVSKPGTAGGAGDPFAIVGSLPGGTQTSVATTDLGAAGQKAQQALNDAGQAKIAAGEQKAAIQQEVADARMLHAAQSGDAAAKANSAIQLHNERVTQETGAAAQDIKTANEDYARAAADLGPDHFWQVQGTGQKIGNLIAVAMSGLGNAFSAKGGVQARNGALDLINAAIDRDIDMQKTALQAKERGIRTKESLYQVLRQKGADELEALTAAKAASLGEVDNRMAVAEAKAGTKEAQANLADLRANVQAQQAQELQRVAELTAKRVQSTTTSTPITALQMGVMQAAGQAAKVSAENKAMGLVDKDPSLATKFGQARDAESFRELAKAGLQFDPAERALKVMERLGKKSVLTSAEADTYRTAQTNYAGFIKGDFAQKLGQVTEADEKFLEPLVPTRDGFKVVVGTDDSRFKQVKEDFETRKKALSGYTVRTR